MPIGRWPVPLQVRVVCTTRVGGVSAPPYDSLNLGDHVGDDASAVATNRKMFAQSIRARPVFMKQVHGWSVARLAFHTADGIEADGCITTERGVAGTILVADCLPVLFTTMEGTAVAAAHAGWRGLAGESGRGVIENTVAALLAESRAQAADVLAWLGPCIGPTAFEVGADVKDAFEAATPSASSFFKPHREGKWLADLPGLTRARLQALGITGIHGNDGSTEWCTVSNPSRFFSHRRDGTSGRFAASIWLA